MLQGRAFLTEQEVAALQERYAQIFAGDGDAAFGDAIFEAVLLDVQKYSPTTFDVPTGNYNAFWLVERDFDNRTSLITDPPDGRMPPVVPEAAGRTMKAYPTQSAEGPEARGLSERCITFGVPDVLAGYNSYYQIVQSPDAVVIHSEKIHDARIVLPRRPAARTGGGQFVARRFARALGRRHAGRRDDQPAQQFPDRLRRAAPDRALHARRPEHAALRDHGRRSAHLDASVDADDPAEAQRAAHLRVRLPRRQRRTLRYPVGRTRGRSKSNVGKPTERRRVTRDALPRRRHAAAACSPRPPRCATCNASPWSCRTNRSILRKCSRNWTRSARLPPLPAPVAATSASSPAARCPRRSRRTCWPAPGTRARGWSSARRSTRISKKSAATGSSRCSACPRRRKSASPPARRWRTSPGSRLRDTRCCARTVGTSKRKDCSARRRSPSWSARKFTSAC